jgi:hypothetical protein
LYCPPNHPQLKSELEAVGIFFLNINRKIWLIVCFFL